MDVIAASVVGLVAGVALARWRMRSAVRIPGGAAPAPPRRSESGLQVVPRRRLPRFENVGGHEPLKEELRDTIGLLLQHPEQAERFKITWNGLLFHGPPGCGKSFIVRALAGELDLNLIPISTSDLVTEVVGEGPARVEEAFRFAASHRPCVLFFDELDALAARRNESDARDGRAVLTQLLQSVEQWRTEPTLLVVGATNDLDGIDPALIRPGRFDRHIRIDLPDHGARRSILEVALAGRPQVADLPLDELAGRTQGRTAAGLVQLCDVAALMAFRASIGAGAPERITADHLMRALRHGAGGDRPTVEDWSWSRLVLPTDVLAELAQIQALLTDPGLARQMGVTPPSGVLLTGPPGTGKTTVAKVLAAEAGCSFYPASSAELSSRWVGESEKAISRLFQRARANAPAIVFLDEIDALGAARGSWGAYDRQLDQLLQELDGLGTQPGVLLLAATNRPNALDPALLRAGRLGNVIELTLPDEQARLAILEGLTRGMPLRRVNLARLASATEGFSGADLKGLCQQAAIESMMRDPGDLNVTTADFREALEEGSEVLSRRAESAVEPPTPRRRTLRAAD